ncbi:hypothetical protein XENOCAPTIV_023253, partial [Xenoophorus captivus]
SKQPIHILSPSEDGQWLATANTGCEIHVFNLRKMKLHCSVPAYSSCPTAVFIHPTSCNLVSVHADQQIFEFSLKQKEYTKWSRQLQRQGLHPLWLQRDTPITRVTFNPKNPAHIVLHDTFMFCIIDQSLVRKLILSGFIRFNIILSFRNVFIWFYLLSLFLKQRRSFTIRCSSGVFLTRCVSERATPSRSARTTR